MDHPWDMGLTYILDFLQLPYFDIATVVYATSMTTPGIDYGLYLDDYDISVIDYNTVTM